ncbi:hypothetical protein BDK51DRAFT_27285 [Blyttiomyces helicus]|uniref:Tubulin--tyrosine ligase-like protein 12 SET-like domain-containing protein n=1 Tax=Blyttiomyces helicus TaxID=388810 RepID=A0A4P9WCG6_9FUNG|nr:hypothetical protein BDK51DRAFT_27285 [Blyttiomyces helicus]|eukprot:RKO90012.1 hypothetical protein BDK51DRAFT_27285 [Blyttiomyces helicus]
MATATPNSLTQVERDMLAAQIPQSLWPALLAKLKTETFNAGSLFALAESESEHRKYDLQLLKPGGLEKEGEVFLIDHAWTFEPEKAAEQLIAHPALVARLEGMMLETLAEESSDAAADSDDVAEALDIIVSQTGATRDAARASYDRAGGQLVDAIAALTIDPEAAAEAASALAGIQEQVLGNVAAQHTESRERQKDLRLRVKDVVAKLWAFAGTYQAGWRGQDGVVRMSSVWYVMDEVGTAVSHSDAPNVAIVPFIYVSPAGAIPYSVMWPVKRIEEDEIVTRDYVPAGVDRMFLVGITGLDRDAYLNAFFPNARDALSAHFKKISELPPTKTPAVLATSLPALVTPSDVIKIHSTSSISKRLFASESVVVVDDSAGADIAWVENPLVSDLARAAEAVRSTYATPDWFTPTYPVATSLASFAGNYFTDAPPSQHLWLIKDMTRITPPRLTPRIDEALRQRDVGASGIILQKWIEAPALYGGRRFEMSWTVLVARGVGGDAVLLYETPIISVANDPFILADYNSRARQFPEPRLGTNGRFAPDSPTFVKNLEREHPDRRWADVRTDITRVIAKLFAAVLAAAGPGAAQFGLYRVTIELTSTLSPVIVDFESDVDFSGVRAWAADPGAAIAGAALGRPDTGFAIIAA